MKYVIRYTFPYQRRVMVDIEGVKALRPGGRRRSVGLDCWSRPTTGELIIRPRRRGAFPEHRVAGVPERWSLPWPLRFQRHLCRSYTCARAPSPGRATGAAIPTS